MTAVEIPLTQGFVALVDSEDYDRVMAAGKWRAKLDGRTFYAIRNSRHPGGKQFQIRLHVFLTGYTLTDHINGNGLDNRRANLREATQAQNVQNRRRTAANTSGFKGVSWHRQARKWQAQIKSEGRTYHLGIHSSPRAAALAYDAAARELHGDFARLNFPLAGERSAA